MTAPSHGITEVMEAIREAALRADFAAMERLSARLETVFTPEDHLDPLLLQGVAELARGNETCLRAALLGVRSARRRVAELAAAARAETYDCTGRRHGHPAGQPVCRL
ncbi:hypothetical protein GU927_008240 [Rhodobacteraceae bacterium HSP-20]|uniref:Uncharacterized protein n=1 Tax=Paragemmobacter amnigenus TaxID=2852097 RepID=A0ABS6J256_9RHOB|nr:hypothetical protein [Rhodobacter amnigenus]MBU9697836.1 hypothetical protein [Rhodobacter amnigenus]MBV4389063.1 hypothetical protein [Rhodobacter amnigenus]